MSLETPHATTHAALKLVTCCMLYPSNLAPLSAGKLLVASSLLRKDPRCRTVTAFVSGESPRSPSQGRMSCSKGCAEGHWASLLRGLCYTNQKSHRPKFKPDGRISTSLIQLPWTCSKLNFADTDTTRIIKIPLGSRCTRARSHYYTPR